MKEFVIYDVIILILKPEVVSYYIPLDVGFSLLEWRGKEYVPVVQRHSFSLVQWGCCMIVGKM